MYSVMLLTVIGTGAGSVTETQIIETVPTIDECLDFSGRFQPRKIILPTGQMLTIKLACEKQA